MEPLSTVSVADAVSITDILLCLIFKTNSLNNSIILSYKLITVATWIKFIKECRYLETFFLREES